MFTCYICKDSNSCNVKQLFKHFKDAHYLIDQHAKYVCCQGSCSRMYNDKFSFGRHLTSVHSDRTSEQPVSKSPRQNTDTDVQPSHNQDDTQSVSELPISKKPKLDIKDLAAKYIGQCKARTGTLQQANLMAKSCNSLVALLLPTLLKMLSNLSSYVQQVNSKQLYAAY